MVSLKTKKSMNRGMSLVELIVVMAILSVVIMAVISLYVPAHQSTIAQTQVADVQENIRLALKTMTRDILHAGFLAPTTPIHDTSTTAFTIDTRIVGTSFARISLAENGPGASQMSLTVTDPDMVTNFPDGSIVRIFEPINATEVQEDPVVAGINDDDRAYSIATKTSNKIVIDISSNSTLDAADILAESVLVKVSDQNAPPMQTIRYQLNNDSLERVINGTQTQVLARNIDTDPASSSFLFETTDDGRVNKVNITLTGKTRALKNDAISGEKTRSVQTTIKLRNVF